MTKINTIVSLAVAGLMLSTGAAAANFPAAGEAPFFNEPVAASSTLQRADVRVATADQQPLSGNVLALADAHLGHSTISRSEVRAEAAHFTPVAGELIAVQQIQSIPVQASVNTGPAAQPVIVAAGEMPLVHADDVGHSALQRSDVRVTHAAQQPQAGNVPGADRVASSTLERSEVRAEAAAHQPAAGEINTAA